MRIFGFLLILFMFVGCEDRLGDTTVKSLSGKSYRSDQSLQFRTNLIKDFNTNGSTLSVDLGNHLVVDGGIFYTTNHPLFGDELFYWDQASGEAHLVEDLNFGPNGSNIRKMKRFNNYLYFFATTAGVGTELRRVDINQPYSIETFDVVAGLGMMSVVDADDPTLSSTDYNIVNNKLVIYNHYEGVEVVDLETYVLNNITDNNGYNPSDFGNISGGVELNGNIYFKSFYQSNWEYFILENNLSDLNLLSGPQYLRSATGSFNMVVHKDAIFFPATGTDSNKHMFAHKGNSSDDVVLINFSNRFPGASPFSSVTRIFATPNYIYMHARDNGGANAYFRVTVDTNTFFHSSVNLNMSPSDIPIDQLVVGDDYCVNSFHSTPGSSRDLVCYRALQDDVHVIKTNFSGLVPGPNVDFSSHIISDLSDTTNGGSDFHSEYTVTNNKLYFIARTGFDGADAGTDNDYYAFELDLQNLSLRTTSSAGATLPATLESSATMTVADVAGLAGVYDLINNQLLSYPLQTQISVGDGISSDSSNPKVIVDSKRFILFVRDDQALTSTPYTDDMEGDLYVYDRELDTTYTINNPGTSNPIVYEQSIPSILQKAFVKVMDQKAFIEVGVFNLGNNERTLLIFDLITGSYEFIELYDFNDPVDLEKILDIYKVGNHYVLYAKDNENSGEPVFFEITSDTKLKPLAVEVTGTRTNPIVKNNMLYFLHNDSVETLYRIRDIGTSLIKEQAGPAGLTLPASAFWKFTTDNENFYFNVDNSGEKLYYINIETPLTNGYVLDETNAQVSDQTFLFKKGKLYTTDVTLISKPLYLIDTSSGTPIAKEVETIEQEYFFNGANDPVYKVGNQIKRIDKNGEIVDYIDTFDQYSDPVCNSLAFASLPSDRNFIFKEGALIYRDNGAGADDLCFYGVNGDSINFGSFGYNVNGLEIGVIADLGERVFFAISRPGNQVDLISMDTNDSSFVVLESNVTLFSEKPAGFKLNSNTIYYCDENLYAIDIASNTSDLIDESFQCDPRTFHISSSQSGIMLSGMDRDNYVGYELYEVR